MSSEPPFFFACGAQKSGQRRVSWTLYPRSHFVWGVQPLTNGLCTGAPESREEIFGRRPDRTPPSVGRSFARAERTPPSVGRSDATAGQVFSTWTLQSGCCIIRSRTHRTAPGGILRASARSRNEKSRSKAMHLLGRRSAPWNPSLLMFSPEQPVHINALRRDAKTG